MKEIQHAVILRKSRRTYPKMKNIFPALIGNNSIKKLCGEDILRGKFAHAYIIDGPHGSGKHTAARMIAMSILCQNRSSNAHSLPCSVCPSCKKIKAGYSTCIQYINRGDNATLQVDAVRNGLATLGYRPEDGDYKFYIIEDAEKMTVPAQNALLLSLEEPPPYAVFILLTSDSGALLETIRSRAHVLKTELLSASNIYKELCDMKEMGTVANLPDEKLQSAAAAAMGSLGFAIELLDQKSSSTHIMLRDKAEKLVKTLLSASSAETVMVCREFDLKRTEYEKLFYFALCVIRDYISLKTGSNDTLFFTDGDEAFEYARKVSLAELYKLYNMLESAQDDICKKNASANTVLTTLAANARCK